MLSYNIHSWFESQSQNANYTPTVLREVLDKLGTVRFVHGVTLGRMDNTIDGNKFKMLGWRRGIKQTK